MVQTLLHAPKVLSDRQCRSSEHKNPSAVLCPSAAQPRCFCFCEYLSFRSFSEGDALPALYSENAEAQEFGQGRAGGTQRGSDVDPDLLSLVVPPNYTAFLSSLKLSPFFSLLLKVFWDTSQALSL